MAHRKPVNLAFAVCAVEMNPEYFLFLEINISSHTLSTFAFSNW